VFQLHYPRSALIQPSTLPLLLQQPHLPQHLQDIDQQTQHQILTTPTKTMLPVQSQHVRAIPFLWLLALQAVTVEIPFWDFMIHPLVKSWPMAMPILTTTVILTALLSPIHSHLVAAHMNFWRDAGHMKAARVKCTTLVVQYHLLHHWNHLLTYHHSDQLLNQLISHLMNQLVNHHSDQLISHLINHLINQLMYQLQKK